MNKGLVLMSLKRLVANEDWPVFIEYLDELEKTLFKNSMNAKTTDEMFKYQGEYRVIQKLKNLKERLKNG